MFQDTINQATNLAEDTNKSFKEDKTMIITNNKTHDNSVTEVKLCFAGLMQRYGKKPVIKSGIRYIATHDQPTESAIYGIICRAMGIRRDDTEGLRYVQDNIRIESVTAVKPGEKMVDHCHNSYTGERSLREYLADAEFEIVISGEKENIEEVCERLYYPVHPIYLGAENCIPMKPVLAEEEAYKMLRQHKGCR